MSRISGLLILLSVSLITVLVVILGVWGAPLAMLVVYFLLTYLVKLELKKVSSVR
jgi:phage shock protein PspC (stress-responsive transcriptional regulator)